MSKGSHIRDEISDGNGKFDATEYQQTVMRTPGYGGVSHLAAYIKAGALTLEDAGFIDDFTERLVGIIVRSCEGDETATTQIKAIGKLLHPEVNNLAQTDIQKVLDFLETHHTPAPLAQGWAVRRMMGRLSWAVEPVPPAKSVLKGKVRLTESNDYNQDVYELASAAFQNIGRERTTLQALAINVLQREDPAFGEMSYEAICKAVREVEKWEESLPDTDMKAFEGVPEGVVPKKAGGKWTVVVGGENTEHLLTRDYSEGWKKRKRLSKSNE